ncbi:beta-lactamase family protein [bacterium]|jgi:CubicO group peptidase (beta-lactamase class C family)|nr:beta-lactamase family protein [bacterium]
MKTYPFSKTIAFICVLTLSSICRANEIPYFPPESGEWESIDPSEVGWNKAKLNQLVKAIGEQKSSGLLILQNGKILIEKYYPSEMYDTDGGKFSRRLHGKVAYGSTIEDVASAQKSIAALIVGIAQQKGLLSLKDPVHKHLGVGWSRATEAQESKVTVRHLISMSSGLKDDLSFEAPAGTRWRYNTTAYSHCMHVAAAASGMKAKDMVKTWLFDPLGMNDSEWIFRAGQEHANIKNSNIFGLATTTRDLARVGMMVLNNGVWDGETIIADKQFLHDATHPSQEMNPSYGYLWWLNGQSIVNGGASLKPQKGPLIQSAPADLYAAQGALQRKLYVVPSMNLVVTRLGNQPSTKDFNNQFWKRLMAAAPK